MPTNPKADRGRFIGMRSRRVIPFMFNPDVISIDHGWSWGSHTPFGRSHPLYGGGVGEDEIISFTLYFDGDRGRSDSKLSFVAAESGHPNPYQDVPLDVMPEINRVRAMKLPYDDEYGIAYNMPETFFLSIGKSLRAEVSIRSVGTKLTAFLPIDLAVLRGETTITCHIEHMANQTSWAFSSREAYNRFTRFPGPYDAE